MTRDEFGAMLERMAAGWAAGDYDSVSNEFAVTLFYCDPLNYCFYDRASLLRFFKNDGGRPQYCKFHSRVFDDSTQQGAAEYTYSGTYQYHGTVWIKIGDGKIVSWREYQHKSDRDWKSFWGDE